MSYAIHSPLPKLNSPIQSPKPQANTFRVYNPSLLSLDESRFQLDEAKDSLIHLKTKLFNQQKQFDTLSQRRAIIKAHLLGNANAINSVLSANANPTDCPEYNSSLSNGVTKHSFHLSPLASPLTKSKRLNFLNTLEQSNQSLERQIVIKDYEIKSLRKTESVSRYTVLNSNYNSNSTEFTELRKGYDLLKLQYDELKSRLNRTIEQRNTLQSYVSRYKLQWKQYSRLLGNFNTPASSPRLSSRQLSQNDLKELNEVKQSKKQLHKRIEELEFISKRNEAKAKDIQSQIAAVENKTGNVLRSIGQLESEVKQVSSLRVIEDFNEAIFVLNSDIDVLKQSLNEANENNSKKVNQIGVYEREMSNLECELYKQTVQNETLKEIINEDKERSHSLKDIDTENIELLEKLQLEVSDLKGKNQTVFSQRL